MVFDYRKTSVRQFEIVLYVVYNSKLFVCTLVYEKRQHMSCVMRKPNFWFLTYSDTNQAVQLQKMARGLKLRIQKVEGLHYLCSENKGADQLCSNRESDLHLCFCICKTLVFS